MSNSSKQAYHLGVELGTHNAIRVKVYNCIKQNEYIGLEGISKLLEIKEKSVSGRITELKDRGAIWEVESRSGKVKSLYRVTFTKSEVRQMIEKQDKERFYKWIKCGNANDYFNKLNLIK